ncbi:MFS transporter [Streptomyces sp. NPDC059176]|uniref:MFS transporter n=1 Tax=unclassified Streptomyces TaxID=2593676 RepID=UPI00367A540A
MTQATRQVRIHDLAARSRTWAADIRAWCPPELRLLLAGLLLLRAAGFAYPFLSYLLAGKGHGTEVAGVVLAAFGAGWVGGQVACGRLLDRFGRRPTLVAAALVSAAVMPLLTAATSPTLLVAGAVALGLVFDTPRVVVGAAIDELVPEPGRHAKLNALRYGLVVNGGALVAGGVGGLLAAQLGVDALYWINAAASALFAVGVLRRLPAGRRHRAGPAKEDRRGGFRLTRHLVLLLGSGLATMTALVGIAAALPMTMAARGLPPGAYGLTALVNSLAVAALTPAMTPWLSRRAACGRSMPAMAAVGSVAIAVPMAAAALAQTTPGFIVAAAACAPGEITWFVATAHVLRHMTPPGGRGRYHGIWGTVLAAAGTLSPLLAAWGLRHGSHVLAVATLAAGLAGAALCIPLGRAPRTDRGRAGGTGDGAAATPA